MCCDCGRPHTSIYGLGPKCFLYKKVEKPKTEHKVLPLDSAGAVAANARAANPQVFRTATPTGRVTRQVLGIHEWCIGVSTKTDKVAVKSNDAALIEEVLNLVVAPLK